MRWLALPPTQEEKHFTYDHSPKELSILPGNSAVFKQFILTLTGKQIKVQR